MENASKALIIAGAIIISIIIIGVGMLIINQTSSSSDVSGTISENEIIAFNRKFENYKGIQNGSSIISLIAAVRANNNTNQDGHKVAINKKTDASGVINTQKLSELTNAIKKNRNYKVILEYNANGFIDNIKIEEKDGTEIKNGNNDITYEKLD